MVHTSINFAPLEGGFWAGEEKVRKINSSLHQTDTIASKARSSLGYGPNISGIENSRPLRVSGGVILVDGSAAECSPRRLPDFRFNA